MSELYLTISSLFNGCRLEPPIPLLKDLTKEIIFGEGTPSCFIKEFIFGEEVKRSFGYKPSKQLCVSNGSCV